MDFFRNLGIKGKMGDEKHYLHLMKFNFKKFQRKLRKLEF